MQGTAVKLGNIQVFGMVKNNVILCGLGDVGGVKYATIIAKKDLVGIAAFKDDLVLISMYFGAVKARQVIVIAPFGDEFDKSASAS